MTEQKTLATHGGCCPTCGYEMSAYQWSNHQSCPKCATPSLPDTQERYPSYDLCQQWRIEGNFAVGHMGSVDHLAAFIARKACDWQREQDALICERLPVRQYHYPLTDVENEREWARDAAGKECASAIRTPPQPGAAQ